MSNQQDLARRQLRSELREIGFWPNKQEVEPFLAQAAQEGIRERISKALHGLEPAELIVVERVVNTLQGR